MKTKSSLTIVEEGRVKLKAFLQSPDYKFNPDIGSRIMIPNGLNNKLIWIEGTVERFSPCGYERSSGKSCRQCNGYILLQNSSIQHCTALDGNRFYLLVTDRWLLETFL